MTDISIWQRIAAPLDPSTIAWRQDGKPTARDGKFSARFVAYIEANTVRERLDSIVPGEWDLSLEPLKELMDEGGKTVDEDARCAFKARLTILGTSREDVGHGKDYKQASTDAFKRVAVRFGIGHELYDYDQNWVPVDGDGKYAKPLRDPGEVYAAKHRQPRAQSAPSAVEKPEPAKSPATSAQLGKLRFLITDTKLPAAAISSVEEALATGGLTSTKADKLIARIEELSGNGVHA